MFHLNPWFFVTLIGTPELWLGIAIGLVFVYFAFKKGFGKERKKVMRFLEVFIVSLLLVFVAVLAVKNVSSVPRPCGLENPYCSEDFSFPSGHAASIFVFFTALFLFWRGKSLPLFIIPILVAYSRVALGVHTVADVVAGGVLGIVVTLIIWKFFWKRKRKK